MISDGGLRGALTALFAVLAAWYLVAALRPLLACGQGPRRQVLSSGLHVLMSATMVSIFWSGGNGIPVIALVTVFTAAAGWFAGHAVFGVGQAGAGDGYEASPAVNWGHAGMMGVMVWMAVLIPLTAGSSGPGAPSAAGRPSMAGLNMTGGAMAGMNMSGQVGTGTVGSGTTVAAITPAGSPAWTGAVCLVLAAALFALAGWRAVTALSLLASPARGKPAGRPGGPGPLLSEGAVTLMVAGMAVALLEMA